MAARVEELRLGTGGGKDGVLSTYYSGVSAGMVAVAGVRRYVYHNYRQRCVRQWTRQLRSHPYNCLTMSHATCCTALQSVCGVVLCRRTCA